MLRNCPVQRNLLQFSAIVPHRFSALRPLLPPNSQHPPLAAWRQQQLAATLPPALSICLPQPELQLQQNRHVQQHPLQIFATDQSQLATLEPVLLLHWWQPLLAEWHLPQLDAVAPLLLSTCSPQLQPQLWKHYPEQQNLRSPFAVVPPQLSDGLPLPVLHLQQLPLAALLLQRLVAMLPLPLLACSTQPEQHRLVRQHRLWPVAIAGSRLATL